MYIILPSFDIFFLLDFHAETSFT